MRLLFMHRKKRKKKKNVDVRKRVFQCKPNGHNRVVASFPSHLHEFTVCPHFDHAGCVCYGGVDHLTHSLNLAEWSFFVNFLHHRLNIEFLVNKAISHSCSLSVCLSLSALALRLSRSFSRLVLLLNPSIGGSCYLQSDQWSPLNSVLSKVWFYSLTF